MDNKDKPIRIGAKFLASLALPTFCQRCFWYRVRGGAPPFSNFPSIFNDIDHYTKALLQANIDKNGCPPKWLTAAFADVDGYENVGFLKWHDQENGIMLTGGPDAVFHGKDESLWCVLDYKTARYTDGQDAYLAQYKVQLLSYAFLLEKNGYKRPEVAALVYFQPPAEPTYRELLARTEKDGFALPLSVEVVEVKLGDFETITDYLGQIRAIYYSKTSPKGREGCKDCMRLALYVRLGKTDSRPKNIGLVLDHVSPEGGSIPTTLWVDKDETILADDDGFWFPDWED